jgi:predicted metal-dependent HD superfamily phosphohydrolase
MTPALRQAYSEPHRRYHTLEHIADCLAQLSEVEGLSGEERHVLELAIWWHDAVYDPTRADNEERSAELARADLARLGEPAGVIDEVARLILLTKGHTVAPGDRLGAVLVSIDLSILGREPAAYDRYATGVREEYAFVPDEAFRTGRAAVLRKFLDARAIYADPAFAARYEAQARSNIARELAALEA